MVERTRRADGARFLGCQRYPTCRGTRELVAIDTPMPSTTAPAVAGASARSTYERRLAKHQDTTRAIRPLILTAGTVIVLTGLVLLTQESTLPILGLSLILFGVVWTLAGLFIKPDHVRAWRIGAEGEERVGVVLDALIADGFRILHDRRRPGGRDNIDHVVIGPPGIIVVETKHYQGKVRIQGGELVINGRRKTAFYRPGPAPARIGRPGPRPPGRPWPHLHGRRRVPVVQNADPLGDRHPPARPSGEGNALHADGVDR
jgi:ssDNA-binding Zn-finger/Zn-ribbon topoisomerase 1